MSKKTIYAILIFISGFLTKSFLSKIAKHTHKLLEEKPDQCPYCGYYFDEED